MTDKLVAMDPARFSSAGVADICDRTNTGPYYGGRFTGSAPTAEWQV
jgi:hypothetical protein